MENDGSYVKEYLAWAIGKIGGADAKKILEVSLDREDDPRVVNEIETALKKSANIFDTY